MELPDTPTHHLLVKENSPVGETKKQLATWNTACGISGKRKMYPRKSAKTNSFPIGKRLQSRRSSMDNLKKRARNPQQQLPFPLESNYNCLHNRFLVWWITSTSAICISYNMVSLVIYSLLRYIYIFLFIYFILLLSRFLLSNICNGHTRLPQKNTCNRLE